MPDVHAVLSASAAERWMNCPGSVAATKDLPNKSSVYAEEGTLAHSLCELKLRKLFGIPEPMKRSTFIKEHNKIKADPLYQPEMENCSDAYVAHIQSIVMQYPQRPFIAVEQQVRYDTWVPQGFGTSDCVIIAGHDLHVVDYKHGQGVPVSAVDNPQLKLYALGCYQLFGLWTEIQTVHLHVIQPRLDNFSDWDLPLADLKQWAEEKVVPAAKLALSDNAPFCPGEAQCRFCGIRGNCRARAEMVAGIRNDPSFGKLPPTLTDAEIGPAIAMAKEVADWQKKLTTHATDTLLHGGNIPGYKLVAGRTTRVWDDVGTAFDDMASKGMDDSLLWERVPLTPAKLEKAIEKKLFAAVAAPHITTAPGKPTLVPESDRRPAWSAAEADFADLINK